METHYGIFCGTNRHKDWEYPLLLDPLRYLLYMEGCNYTNSCGIDSTHSSTWCKQKGDLVPGTDSLWSCLQVSLCSVGCSCTQIILAEKCFGPVGDVRAKVVRQRTRITSPSRLMHTEEVPCCFYHCGWHGPRTQQFNACSAS